MTDSNEVPSSFQETVKDYPLLPEQAKNLAQFAFDVVKGVVERPSNLYATDEVFNQRLEVCKECEFYDSQQVRCRQCGCWLKYKAKYGEGSCPLGKW